MHFFVYWIASKPAVRANSVTFQLIVTSLEA